MKKILLALIVSVLFCYSQAFAHHAADGVVDDEIYEQIEVLIADTPHADMTLADLGAGMTTITIVIDGEAYSDIIGDLTELIDELHGMTTINTIETPNGDYIVTVVTHGEDYNYNEDNNSSYEDAPHHNPN